MNSFLAGASAINITPSDSQFLFGYPHVKRYSTGVHDAIYSSALYLDDGTTDVIFIANDVIGFAKATTTSIRKKIEARTGVGFDRIVVTATHTHSAPITLNMISNADDPVVPPVDERYMAWLEERVVSAAVDAYKSKRPARVGLALADATGVGTNRHDPLAIADPTVPVLLARGRDGVNIGCVIVHAMHPTVLHEDSTLISADFPGMARQYLQKHALGENCPVLHIMGAAGDQSPRHRTRGNTFDEATRLGNILGDAVASVIGSMRFDTDHPIRVAKTTAQLSTRSFPAVADAQTKLSQAKLRFETLKKDGAPRVHIRTAECDCFGAEETLTLAKAGADTRLAAAAAACMPADITLVGIGPFRYVSWQGEIFVEFALKVRKKFPNTFIMTMSNGDLQGYLVNDKAVRRGWYEGANALFQSPQGGEAFVKATEEMLAGRSSDGSITSPKR